jgi:general secretion pathway protein N
MKRTLRMSILAILAFAIILLVRLPASWFKGFVPADIACAEISGTVWDGSCTGLAYHGAAVGNLAWELHPAALLRGKLAAFVDLARGDDFIRGDIEVGRGSAYVGHDLQAQIPLDPPLLPELSSGFSGNVSVNLASLRVEKNVIAALEGQVETTSLYSKRDRVAIGGYSVTFPKAPAGSDPVGQVTSLDGPVDFQGTLKLTRAPGWVVEGKVRVKPETPPELANQLEYLGRPDADGTRPLSLEGTF